MLCIAKITACTQRLQLRSSGTSWQPEAKFPIRAHALHRGASFSRLQTKNRWIQQSGSFYPCLSITGCPIRTRGASCISFAAEFESGVHSGRQSIIPGLLPEQFCRECTPAFNLRLSSDGKKGFVPKNEVFSFQENAVSNFEVSFNHLRLTSRKKHFTKTEKGEKVKCFERKFHRKRWRNEK